MITENDWTALKNEYSICRKKLESKREGLKILMKELEQTQIERDVSRNKVRQLQSELSGLKDIVGSFWKKSENGATQLDFSGITNDKKIKTLSNLLQFSRDENQHLRNDLTNLRHLYGETQKDNQLLRKSLGKYEERTKTIILNQEGKEKLIVQLEEANNKIEILEQETQLNREHMKELEEERNNFRDKNERLNTELNYILHNDDRRIVDIDAIVLENQYLKEVIKQYKEEKSIALGTAARYKEALKQRQAAVLGGSSGRHAASSEGSSGKSSEGFFFKSTNSVTVADLQRVNKALTEKVAEKETALKHQRNTNKVLGNRVSELEKKLKTLEISGLWSHEQRFPRFKEHGDICSPPTSPTDAYIPVLVAETADTYGENSSKQNNEENIAITRKQENGNNGVGEIYTEEEDPYRRSKRLLSNESNYSDDIKSLAETTGTHLEDRNGDSDDVLAINTQAGSVNELNLEQQEHTTSKLEGITHHSVQKYENCESCADKEQLCTNIEDVHIEHESKLKIVENVETVSSTDTGIEKKKTVEFDQNRNFEIEQENSEKLNGLTNNGNEVSVKNECS